MYSQDPNLQQFISNHQNFPICKSFLVSISGTILFPTWHPFFWDFSGSLRGSWGLPFSSKVRRVQVPSRQEGAVIHIIYIYMNSLLVKQPMISLLFACKNPPYILFAWKKYVLLRLILKWLAEPIHQSWPMLVPSFPKFSQTTRLTWMSQEVSKWLGSVGCNPKEYPIYR